MNKKILFIDDDANLLEGYKRNLRTFFEIETANSAKEGLEKIIAGGNYSVVIADMRMPETDGIKFLSMVKEKNPDIVRMMLTGNADIDTAINAVNDGNIFRFLTKPCAPEILKKSIDDGVEQNRLIISEKELMQKTLLGIIKILSEILSIVNATAFGRAIRVTKMAVKIAEKLKLKDILKVELASMLSHIGCISIPEDILERYFLGLDLMPGEADTLKSYTKMGFELLSKIPRLEQVAKIIYYQEKYFNGTGYPKDDLKEESLPIESRILKILLDFDTLSIKNSKKEALEIMKNKRSLYDTKVLDILAEIIIEEEKSIRAVNISNVNINDLKDRMMLAEDVYTKSGKLLLPKGLEVTSYLKTRLINYAKNIGVKEPLKVSF